MQYKQVVRKKGGGKWKVGSKLEGRKGEEKVEKKLVGMQ